MKNLQNENNHTLLHSAAMPSLLIRMLIRMPSRCCAQPRYVPPSVCYKRKLTLCRWSPTNDSRGRNLGTVFFSNSRCITTVGVHMEAYMSKELLCHFASMSEHKEHSEAPQETNESKSQGPKWYFCRAFGNNLPCVQKLKRGIWVDVQNMTKEIVRNENGHWKLHFPSQLHTFLVECNPWVGHCQDLSKTTGWMLSKDNNTI